MANVVNFSHFGRLAKQWAASLLYSNVFSNQIYAPEMEDAVVEFFQNKL